MEKVIEGYAILWRNGEFCEFVLTKTNVSEVVKIVPAKVIYNT